MNPHVIRVSCSGLLRALYYTPKERRQILRPIGGSLRAPARTITMLGGKYGAALFEGDNRDLRFVVSTDMLGDLTAWFALRRDRETDIRRLATAHLVQLGVLEARDVRRIEFSFAYQAAHSGQSPQELPVRRTHYMIDVFDAVMPDAVFARVKACAAGGARVLNFVSKDEASEHQGPGGYVSSLAPTLFRR